MSHPVRHWGTPGEVGDMLSVLKENKYTWQMTKQKSIKKLSVAPRPSEGKTFITWQWKPYMTRTLPNLLAFSSVTYQWQFPISFFPQRWNKLLVVAESVMLGCPAFVYKTVHVQKPFHLTCEFLLTPSRHNTTIISSETPSFSCTSSTPLNMCFSLFLYYISVITQLGNLSVTYFSIYPPHF